MPAGLPASLLALPDPAADGELLRRWAADGDEAAFAAVVRRHAGMVAGTCRRVLGASADADDAFQAAFVVLARKADALAARRCVGDWLYGVAFHTALKANAMAATRRAKEAKATRPAPAEPPAEELRALDEELARLPEKLRGPVVLCELEGVSRRDAAARLGIPEGTISSRLATAHRMLKARLAARGVAGVFALLAVVRAPESAVAAVPLTVSAPPPAVARLASEVSRMLLFNKLKTGAAALAVLVAVGVGVGPPLVAGEKVAARAPAKPAKAKDDAEAILGTWVVTELGQVGVTPADEQRKGWAAGRFKITFTADTMTYEIDTSSVKYRLDPTKTPKRIELLDGDAVVALGIYELDGDSLKVCVGRKPDRGPPVAPVGFDVEKEPKGTFPTLYVMKRQPANPDRKGGGDAKKADDRKLLVGTWVTKAVSFDPPFPVPPGARQEHAHHTLTFTADELTWVSYTPSDPKTRSEQKKAYKLDQTAGPKELTSGDNECVYELDGDTLKVAMYALAPGRPKGFTAKDSPPKKGGHVWVIELARLTEDAKPDEPKAKPPEKKDEPKKEDYGLRYMLKEGEVVKYVTADTAEAKAARDEFHRPPEKHGWKPVPGTVYRVGMANGKFSTIRPGGGADGGKGKTGAALEHVLAGVFESDHVPAVEMDPKLLGTYLPGDWVVDTAAKPADRVKALQKVLTDDCKVPVELELKELERDVIVASGEWTFTPRAWRKEAVEVYATEKAVDKKLDGVEYLKGAGDVTTFLREVGGFCGKTVVRGEIKDRPAPFKWYLHTRNSEKISEQQEDHDADAILKNVSEQTGLAFKAEKRKVPVLVAKPGK